MTIWYLPLEHVEGRYTGHLDLSISEYLERSGRVVKRVHPARRPDRPSPRPQPGMFLDAGYTIEWKAMQVRMMVQHITQGDVRSGDILWCSDAWFPGLEGVLYAAHFAGVKLELRGFVHAGSFTDKDPVADLRWASAFENMLFGQFDQLYVGTHFAKAELCGRRSVDPARVTVTGLPLDPALVRHRAARANPRERIVVFTGRDSPDKQPDLWRALPEAWRARFPKEEEPRWIWTAQERLPRDEYLHLLATAACVVSFARQENFGFAVREAMFLGCVPVVPDDLAYTEFVPGEWRYRDPWDALDLIRCSFNRTDGWNGNVDTYADAPAIWFHKESPHV